MFDCTRCRDLEKRIETLLANLLTQRDLLESSARKEREMLLAQIAEMDKRGHEERRELYARLQGYTLDQPGPKDPESQATDKSETVDGVYSQQELAAMGLVVNQDGGYVDVRVSPPFLYESVEDCIATRKLLRDHGLPENANPAFLTDGGAASIVELAHEHSKKTNGSQEEE